MRGGLLVALGMCAAFTAIAQVSPTGSHYAGRATDTGYGRQAVGVTGNYATSIPLDLPSARGDLPVPLSLQYIGRGLGAAGAGWDVPYSYIEQRRTLAK